MSLVWKVAVGLVVALMLPVAAYAAGNLTAPTDDPAPRRDIVIVDSPEPTASDNATEPNEAEQEARDRRRDRRDAKRDARDDQDDDRDRVKVVTPQPTPVDDDGDDGDDGDDDDDEWED